MSAAGRARGFGPVGRAARGLPPIPRSYHVCPWPGCPVIVPDAYVGCRPHYSVIPPARRAELATAFINRKRDPQRYREAVRRTWRFLESAGQPDTPTAVAS